MRGCSASCLVGTDDFLSFCFCSILHARRHSSQQVCRHRITGQQLSEHPAADTGRSWVIYWQFFSLCRRVRRKLSCFRCNYWSNSGNLLTAWMYAKIFLIPSLPKTCCTVSSTSSLAPSPQLAINVCICTSVFYSTCVVYHMCSTVYLAHMEPTLQAPLLTAFFFYTCFLSFPSSCPPFFSYFTFSVLLALPHFAHSLPFTFSFSHLLSSSPSPPCTSFMCLLHYHQYFSH